MVRSWNRHCLQGEAEGNWACLVGEGEQVGGTSQQPSSSYKARPLPTREGKANPFIEVHSGRKTMVLNWNSGCSKQLMEIENQCNRLPQEAVEIPFLEVSNICLIKSWLPDKESPEQCGLNSVLTLLWGGHWTGDFPKSPSWAIL